MIVGYARSGISRYPEKVLVNYSARQNLQLKTVKTNKLHI